jgi:hypothetical protein
MAIINVIKIKVVERNEFGIAVILLETVCRAIKVPAVRPNT